MSLRTRLALTHTSVALLAIVVVAVLINLFITFSFRRLSLEQARLEALRLAQPLGGLYERLESWQLVEQRLTARPRGGRPQPTGVRRMLVAEPDGIIVIDTLGDLEGQPMTSKQRDAAAAVYAGQRLVGYVSVLPASGRLGEREDQFLALVNRSIVAIGLGAALIAVLVGLTLARRLSRPIRALTSAAHQLAGGKRGEPLVLPVASRDEVGELTAAFNTMSAELSRQEQLRRQLVADIAHELRTPLSVLRMDLEALEDGVLQLSPEALASLQEEVALLGRLVDDLRLLSLTEAGQLSLSIVELDLPPTLERVAAQAASRARQQQIALSVEYEQDLPAVCADQQRLSQVLSNLVDNALRYTPGGGRIILGAGRQPSAAGDEVCISVSDSGPGIRAEDRERIFERFYRTDRARTRETGGSGLGLAIVKGLVQAMGGRVWAESEPGAGATFLVALPVSKAPGCGQRGADSVADAPQR